MDQHHVVFHILQILVLLHSEVKIDLISPDPVQHENSLINLEYLQRVAGGDQAFVNSMVELFVNKCDDTLAEIKLAIQKGSWVDFKAYIHRFLPSLAFMGIHLLSSQLHEINDLKVAPNDLDIFVPTIEALEDVVKRSKVELVSYLKSTKPNE